MQIKFDGHFIELEILPRHVMSCNICEDVFNALIMMPSTSLFETFRMQKVAPNDFNMSPRTWNLPQEFSQFQSHVKDLKRKNKRKTFILKPANGAMGNGWEKQALLPPSLPFSSWSFSNSLGLSSRGVKNYQLQENELFCQVSLRETKLRVCSQRISGS